MLRTILKEVKEFKFVSLITPVFMILEVVCEMVIPFLMASIVDNGVNAGNLDHIIKTGIVMIIVAVLGLLCGLAGGRTAAMASTGVARN